jgi:hypothetical protein
MTIQHNGPEIVARLAERIKDFQPESPALRLGLTRIGIGISTIAKLNMRRLGMIDTGNLLNSIAYQFTNENGRYGINIGSYGVPYAAINEFGGPFTDRMRRAMFANIRKTKGKKSYSNKNVIQGGHWRARPYLGPAVVTFGNSVVDIMREVLSSDSN